MITIIDYGAGNLQSVKNALDFLKIKNKISDNAKEILDADKIIFPGVGSFGDMIGALEKKGLIPVIKKFIEDKKPFLGICLGMQVLFEESEESPGVKGMGILKGRAKKFATELKVPQIGWNQINIKKQDKLVSGMDGKFFYFVHSYYVEPQDRSIILTMTNYDTNFVSGISKDNVHGFQFHPEKSGEIGLEILKKFAEL